MTLLQKVKRTIRKARVLVTMRPLPKFEQYGGSGKKYKITIQGKEFIIKPPQEEEPLRRQRLIDFLKKEGHEFKSPTLPGGKFTIKVSKRYPVKNQEKRIEPLYSEPMIYHVMHHPTSRAVKNYAAKIGKTAKELSQAAHIIHSQIIPKILRSEELRILTNNHDILFGFENGHYFIRIVDF